MPARVMSGTVVGVSGRIMAAVVGGVMILLAAWSTSVLGRVIVLGPIGVVSMMG
jgi:hypothetical protein